MARPTKEQQKRNSTKEALLIALKKNNNETQYYIDQVEIYMEFYDNLAIINKELSKNNDEIKSYDDYTKLLKEKRLVTKEMRGILDFLGIKPGESKKDEDNEYKL